MKTKEEENWDQQKDILKQRYPELTDRDLDYKEGEIDQMLARISQKTGKPQEAFHPIISPKNQEVSPKSEGSE